MIYIGLYLLGVLVRVLLMVVKVKRILTENDYTLQDAEEYESVISLAAIMAGIVWPLEALYVVLISPVKLGFKLAKKQTPE